MEKVRGPPHNHYSHKLNQSRILVNQASPYGEAIYRRYKMYEERAKLCMAALDGLSDEVLKKGFIESLIHSYLWDTFTPGYFDRACFEDAIIFEPDHNKLRVYSKECDTCTHQLCIEGKCPVYREFQELCRSIENKELNDHEEENYEV